MSRRETWAEARFMRAYQGTDPDALTNDRFYELLELVPLVLIWEGGGDVTPDLMRQEAIRDIKYREAFKLEGT